MKLKLLVATTLMLFVNLGVCGTSVYTYIPKNALPLLPTVAKEIDTLGYEFTPSYMSSHIEKESCLSLTHSKCWAPTSQLFTRWGNGVHREQGVGLGQFTRTWTRSGALRFDTLMDLVNKNKDQLRGLNWDTVKSRPDLQIKAMAILMNNTFSKLPEAATLKNREAMTSSAYNSGYGRLSTDRRTCKLKADCDPNVWFGNVEKIRAKGFSTNILYGKRTAWDVNRDTVKEVMLIRLSKYEKWFADEYKVPLTQNEVLPPTPVLGNTLSEIVKDIPPTPSGTVTTTTTKPVVKTKKVKHVVKHRKVRKSK